MIGDKHVILCRIIRRTFLRIIDKHGYIDNAGQQ